jgi:thiol-disulfide isomerase/thioredoxin
MRSATCQSFTMLKMNEKTRDASRPNIRTDQARAAPVFGLAGGAIAAIQLGKSTAARAQAASMKATSLPIEGEMPSLTGATGWINTSPLTSADLRGKVVLVEFWTYTCINWLRSHAYVRAWAEKYNEHGLVVIGAHTPEFPFEGEVGDVQRAVQDMKLHYPIAVDSDYAIWRAFQNNYWPALYFADAQGRIRHHQFGEGSYEQSETIVQRLLIQAGSVGVGHELASVNGQGIEAAADWANLRSPENYLGYAASRNPGYINSCGNHVRSRTGPLKSSSSMPAAEPMPLRSDRATGWLQTIHDADGSHSSVRRACWG